MIPWRQPWKDGRAPMFPANMLSHRSYGGINVWLLTGRFTSPWWGTYQCAKRCGGHVRRGEKATQIILWKRYTRDARLNDRGPVRETVDGRQVVDIFLLKTFSVFNTEQMDLPESFLATLQPQARTASPIEAAEQVIRRMPNPPALSFGFDHACYYPRRDAIEIPRIEQFDSPAAFYDTLFHELAHSTGHKSRLDRPGVSDNGSPFGGDTYGREELIAELGAAFLCGTVGIEQRTLANSASYIPPWMEAIRGDARLVVTAASAAQKAADYILGATAITAEHDDARTIAELPQAA